MSLVKKKPTSPGWRGAVLPDFSELTSKESKKSLLQPLKKHSGRNNKGRITVRHRGGGHKRKYRIICWGIKKRSTTCFTSSQDSKTMWNCKIPKWRKKDNVFDF